MSDVFGEVYNQRGKGVGDNRGSLGDVFSMRRMQKFVYYAPDSLPIRRDRIVSADGFEYIGS